MKSAKFVTTTLVALSLTLSFCLMASAVSNFTVEGTVTQNGTHVDAGYQVIVKNDSQEGMTSEGEEVKTDADGKYAHTFFTIGDLPLQEGDTIKVTVYSKDGSTELATETDTYSSGNLLVIDVEIEKKGTVSLESVAGQPPSLTWTYKLTCVSGSITEWTYTGAAITGGSVASGSTADTEGWSVKTQTATVVTFEKTGDPMTSGEVSGFVIEGSAAGTGNWTCHDSSSSIDGSLPVVLSSFTALSSDKGVVVSWRTESEIENLGFDVYRSENRDGKFVKINPEIIEGAGISAEPHEYKFVDESVEPRHTYYYYLKSIDFSGDEQQTPIIKVTLLSSREKIITLWGRLKTAD